MRISFFLQRFHNGEVGNRTMLETGSYVNLLEKFF